MRRNGNYNNRSRKKFHIFNINLNSSSILPNLLILFHQKSLSLVSFGGKQRIKDAIWNILFLPVYSKEVDDDEKNVEN